MKSFSYRGKLSVVFSSDLLSSHDISRYKCMLLSVQCNMTLLVYRAYRMGSVKTALARDWLVSPAPVWCLWKAAGRINK